MSKRKDSEFICDIKEAIQRIATYINRMNYNKFLEDIKTQDAVVRNLEIIGDSAKNISKSTKAKYPRIPWKDLAGLRDRLIHHYFGVNYDIVWTIIKEELPAILSRIEDILEKSDKFDNRS